MKICNVLCLLLMGVFSSGFSKNYYFYDKQENFSIETIEQAEFNIFNDAVNQGSNNGVYWLKIEKDGDDKNIIQFTSNHINNVLVYQDGKKVKTIASFGFEAFELHSYPAYVKITTKKEAFIPLTRLNRNNFIKHQQLQSVLIGLFYGFALMVIIVNLFYYINFQDKSFLYYIIFLLVIGVSLSLRDGFFFVLGGSKQFSYYSETFVHSLAGLFGALLACEYLQINRNLPKLIVVFVFLVGIAFVFDAAFLLTDNYVYSTISDVFVYFVFISGWFASLLLFKKYSYAVYFSIAYSLLVVMAFAYFLAPSFGLSNFGVNDNVFKIGSYFEMLIFTYAVVSRMRVLQKENDQMHDEIVCYSEQIKSLSEELSKNQKGESNYFAQFDLSGRENEILNLITQNKSNKEIASFLYISINTVKYHIKNIYQKLQIKSRKEVNFILNSQ